MVSPADNSLLASMLKIFPTLNCQILFEYNLLEALKQKVIWAVAENFKNVYLKIFQSLAPPGQFP